MTKAKEFYKINVEKQREIIERMIKEQAGTGDPVIRLPFDTYPCIEAELDELGWEHDFYKDANGKQCAYIYPKQYDYDYIEE